MSQNILMYNDTLFLCIHCSLKNNSLSYDLLYKLYVNNFNYYNDIISYYFLVIDRLKDTQHVLHQC